jgi:hypothetical protein
MSLESCTGHPALREAGQSVLTDISVIWLGRDSVLGKVATDRFQRQRQTDNFGFGFISSVPGFNRDL